MRLTPKGLIIEICPECSDELFCKTEKREILICNSCGWSGGYDESETKLDKFNPSEEESHEL